MIKIDSKEFRNWFIAARKIIDAYMKKNFPDQPEIPFTASEGRKYIKVKHDNHVYAYINRENGDINLKSLTKHPSGNIFNDDGGLDSVTSFGLHSRYKTYNK